MLLNLRRWFQFGSILKKWRQCNNCHNYLQWWTNLFFLHLPVKYLDYCFFFLSFELTCSMNYNISVAFFLFFTFLQLFELIQVIQMMNSENYLLGDIKNSIWIYFLVNSILRRAKFHLFSDFLKNFLRCTLLHLFILKVIRTVSDYYKVLDISDIWN